jgi:hypothetical protein
MVQRLIGGEGNEYKEKSDKNNPVCSFDLPVGGDADSLLLDGNLVFEDE